MTSTLPTVLFSFRVPHDFSPTTARSTCQSDRPSRASSTRPRRHWENSPIPLSPSQDNPTTGLRPHRQFHPRLAHHHQVMAMRNNPRYIGNPISTRKSRSPQISTTNRANTAGATTRRRTTSTARRTHSMPRRAMH